MDRVRCACSVRAAAVELTMVSGVPRFEIGRVPELREADLLVLGRKQRSQLVGRPALPQRRRRDAGPAAPGRREARSRAGGLDYAHAGDHRFFNE
jgi:hypothetical protein